MNQFVRLLPELNFGEFPIVPAISHNTMIRSWRTCQISRLCGARYSRKGWDNFGTRCGLLERGYPRRILANQRFGQTYNIDDGDPFQTLTRTTFCPRATERLCNS